MPIRSETDKTSNSLCLESYGVSVRLESNDPKLFEEARVRAEHALAGNLRIVEPVDDPHVFRLERKRRGYVQVKNGEPSGISRNKKAFLRYFDSCLRLTIAEYAVGRVFVHAGVVGWKGKAIVIPGKSFSGKTTLVSELVRQGAEYYSDEYAVFDENGFVHPFARRLGVRLLGPEGQVIETDHLTIEALGGTAGLSSIPVGWLLITAFDEDAKWEPRVLTSGNGVLEMLSQTIPIRYAPEFSLEVLKKVATSAIIVKSPRSDAVAFAKFFLDFVDNKAF
jgi:hypothetical protein